MRLKVEESSNPLKVLLAIDGSDCSLAAVKEVAARRWPEGTVVKVFAAVTTRFPSAPDPALIGSAIYHDLMEAERKRLHELVESTAAELRRSKGGEGLRIKAAVADGSPKR